MKGYWQILLQPQDKENTAFTTPKGPFHFTWMPFGLHGAAATFQSLVDTVLNPCEKYTLTYLDDSVVYSKTWEEHLHHLHRVFHELHTAGLHVHPKKSKVGFRELDYLGYTIGGGQL